MEAELSMFLPNYHETNQIEVSDFAGNKTVITIPVVYERI
jgi:hypothetical protein